MGYDLNTVEFAVEDGVPYAIDFMNPAPDADVHSVGQKNFDWIVDKVAKLAVEKAKIAGKPPKELKWSSFMSGGSGMSTEKKSTAQRAPAKKVAEKKIPGAVAKSIERDERDMVKARAENLKALNVKAEREELRREMLPPRKR